ncbi:UDP-2,4-diacetamido-2,4,6-trideoxy-beta-L-altropyranose hydrolase [Salinibacter sp.]|uniref:UDP-2,4-diacetamido-2,4, 6-trideoxy-beta-L-altropyranose hydrolase n=1 Tax=Salinibacter sp. TaxID=2065818 RepID=UPI0021E9AECF|nr:UDP-2,4-diacetamido-2,4,6-trideoxy-beta-L-altropyranose hydrolase [Salinibacter sp.]
MLDPLLIRADASREIGTGHVMRCLALAQSWQQKGGQVYIRGRMPDGLRARLIEEGIELVEVEERDGTLADAQATATFADKTGAVWVVVDGYHFGAAYQRNLREAGHRVLFIDDYGHADRYEADLVLNQNIDAEKGLYANRAAHTNLLLDPTFALLRKEFWPWREPRREIRAEAEHILITLGGVDPDNVTTEVVEALGSLEASNVRATAVIGGSNSHENAIRAAAKSACMPIDVRQNVDDMAELMADSDIAVSAGGSTCWELAFMGIPNVIVVLAENQKGIAQGLDDADTAVNLGWHERVGTMKIESTVSSMLRKEKKRCRMADEAQELVDGWGTDRVASAMTHEPSIRPVQKQDCELLWHWANDPKVRENAYDSDPIPWEDHKEWFEEKLESASSKIYVAEVGSDPIGQIRFDIEEAVAVVDVSVAKSKRGSGYGTMLIERGTRRFLKEAEVERVDAYVKADNSASRKAFEKAGYALKEETRKKGERSYRLSAFAN